MTPELEARAAKYEAMERAAQAAHVVWKATAYEVGVRLACSQDCVTSEDILAAMPRGLRTHNDKAMGPIMLRLAREGYLVKSIEHEVLYLKKNHCRPQQVWVSVA